MPGSEDTAGATRFVIADDGDVNLIVGKDKQELRVNSQCLIWGSNVFRVMFGPHWAEGQNLSTQAPKDLFLEDDNIDAMRAICCVLHHRNGLVGALTGQDVFRIAVAADKYDAMNALKFAMADWLRTSDGVDSTDAAYLMVTAYLFRDQAAFGKWTEHLILNHLGSYMGLLHDESPCRRLPLRTFCTLEEQRTKVRAQLVDVFDDFSVGDACSCDQAEAPDYGALLNDYIGTKAFGEPLASMVQQLEDAPSVELHEEDCDRVQDDNASEYVVRQHHATLGEIKKGCTLCFRCLEEGRSEIPCKWGHF